MEGWKFLLNSKLIVADAHEDTFQKFTCLRTNEERVTFALNLILIYNQIPQLHGDTKNAEKSAELRNEGNNKFKSKPLTSSLCVDVLKLYTRSIAYAPCASEQLALAYGNRSAILKRLHKYEECIQDIDRALDLPFPNKSKHKLYQRKIECLSLLNHSEIKNAINEAQCWLEKMSINDITRKKLNDMFISARKVSNTPILDSNTSNKQSITKQCSLPELNTHSSEIPCASDAITLKYNKEYGRHIVANRDISPGEIIAIEKAYTVMLDLNNLQTHCSNCLEVSWANVPCNYCTYAMYCSEKCKLTDWEKYHDIECGIVPSLMKMDFSQTYLFCLRLAIQAVKESKSIDDLRNELREVENCKDPRTKGFSKNGTFESNAYRSMLSLVTNIDKFELPYLFERSIETAIILCYLAVYTNMFGSPLKDISQLIKNTDVTFVGGLILQHMFLVCANCHTLSEERGVNIADRGVAAMPFLSLLNHSCFSHVVRSSRSNHVVVYTVYPIKKDEQIFDDYGQQFGAAPKSVRQVDLLNRYYFNCNCVACLENWPVFIELKLSSVSKVVQISNIERFNLLIKKLCTYGNIASKGNIFNEHMIHDSLELLKMMCELVSMPHSAIVEIIELLKRIYCLKGNRFDIPEL